MHNEREFLVDIGDIELSVLEWTGSGDPIMLLHATGFHSRCWQQVIKQLPGRHIYAVDLRFHGNSGSNGEANWGVMADDIRILLDYLDLDHVIGVGHSIGGYLIARVAASQGARFKHLLLIDPVIMAQEGYDHFQATSKGLGAKDHPVSRRKNAWRDAQEMYDRFKDRAPFNTWQTRVLRDYCNYALRPRDNESLRQLACDPINEAGIYMHQTGNDVILRQLDSITTRTTLLRAAPAENNIFDLTASPTWPELASALPNCTDVFLPHLNHFIPMQAPELVAKHIIAATTPQ